MAKQTAEKGVLFLTISKVYFLIAGYFLIFSLTRILGPEGYGVYSSVNAFVAVLDAVILIGTIQAVSKFVSEDENQADLVKNTAIKLQIYVGGAVALIYFLCAPYIAIFLNDPSLVPFLRLSALIVISYSFYGIYLGYINGRKQFVKQAFIDMSFTTLKVSFMVGLAYLGLKYTNSVLGEGVISLDLSIYGALGGFALAALLIVVITSFITRSKGEVKRNFPISKLLAFQAAIILFTFTINMLLQTDLILVKKFTTDFNTGIYAASLQLARIPYQAITAVTFVIFPLISAATFRKDTIASKFYINNTLRFTLIIITIIVVLFSSTPEGTILFLYTDKYLPGSEVLSVYVFAVMSYALFFVMTTIISGSGKPFISCIAAIITLLLNFGLNYFAIPKYGIMGAAYATTISMTIGMIITSIIVFKLFNGLINSVNALRILLCGGIIYAISIYYPVEGLLLVAVKFVILWNLYLLLLVITKELTKSDIKIIVNIIPNAKRISFINKYLRDD